MQHEEFQVSEKKNEFRNMSEAVDWAEQIETIAGPYQGNRKSWLADAAKAAKIKYSQARDLFYGTMKDPKHSVASRVLSAADQAKLEQAKRNVQSAAEIYQSHAAALERIDPDFYREHIDILVGASRVLGGRNRTGT
jgi:catalase